MTDLTERLRTMRDGDQGYPLEARIARQAVLTEAINRLAELERTLEGAGNRLTELEAECEHLRAKGLAGYGGRYEEFERAERLREALERIEGLVRSSEENPDLPLPKSTLFQIGLEVRAALHSGVSEGVKHYAPGVAADLGHPEADDPLADSPAADAKEILARDTRALRARYEQEVGE